MIKEYNTFNLYCNLPTRLVDPQPAAKLMSPSSYYHCLPGGQHTVLAQEICVE